MQVIVISGPQAVGKTTLAKELASQRHAPLLSRDPLMGTLAALGQPLAGEETLGLPDIAVIGFYLQSTLLRELLGVGLAPVLEAVLVPEMVQQWADIAAKHGAGFSVVECFMPPDHHRMRFEQRPPQHGWRALEWAEVRATADQYESWTGPTLRLDTAQPLDVCVAAVDAYVARRA